jgi:uncharacterized protein (TIGR02757 family)
MSSCEGLEALYACYTRACYRHTDPVHVLHRYPDVRDREIVAFFAAGLAYGRVASILNTLENFLPRLTASPGRFVDEGSKRIWERALSGFKHRWTRADEVVDVLHGMQRMRRDCGSLENGFLGGVCESDDVLLPALAPWVDRLRAQPGARNSLLADPAGPSACKRLHLFLRWMVRSDAVDPGGWDRLEPARLVVPIDVHMHRAGQAMGFTKRRQGDRRTALEITDGFRALCPKDPVRYDFALTRPGILDGLDARSLAGSPVDVVARLGELADGTSVPKGRQDARTTMSRPSRLDWPDASR